MLINYISFHHSQETISKTFTLSVSVLPPQPPPKHPPQKKHIWTYTHVVRIIEAIVSIFWTNDLSSSKPCEIIFDLIKPLPLNLISCNQILCKEKKTPKLKHTKFGQNHKLEEHTNIKIPKLNKKTPKFLFEIKVQIDRNQSTNIVISNANKELKFDLNYQH